MSATYGILNYFGLFLAFGICWLLVAAGFIVVGFRWRKQGRSQSQKNRLILVHFAVEVGFLLLFFIIFIPAVDATGDLLFSGMYDVRKSSGTVENITPVDQPSVFYAQSGLHGGAEFDIDGYTYFGIHDSSLQKGMTVELDYAHGDHENVILAWHEVTPEQAAQTLSEAKQYEVTVEPSRQEKPLRMAPIAISKELEAVLIWLQYICTAGFIGMVMLQQWFSRVKRPRHWNHRQDHRITFNWAVGGFRFVQFGCIHICLLCACIRGLKYGFDGFSILIIGLILFHFSFFLYDLSRRMEIDGELVTVSRFGMRRQYTASEIRGVKWQMSHKGRKLFPGDSFPFEDWERVIDTYYALVVIMDDGKQYRFPVDTHLGVRSAYEELSDQLIAHGGVPVEEL